VVDFVLEGSGLVHELDIRWLLTEGLSEEVWLIVNFVFVFSCWIPDMYFYYFQQ
jgi:hypothetical protein